MNKTLIRYSDWILAAAIFLSFFASLSMAPLFDLDEGAFSEATREMLQSGNYLTTYLNGELRFDKPILIYWLQALSVKIFGMSEFSFRFPSALAATFWSLGIYWFARRYFDEITAFAATFFMVTSLQITIIAKAAIADALLNMFIAYSMFFVYIYLDKNEKKYLYFAFGAIGFGALTKGPVAILIPLAVTFIYLLIKKELKLFFKTVFNPIGLLIFSLIALPWYILEYMDQGMRFIEGFFLKHNISRFKTSFEGHSGSLFYYIPVVLIGLLPYTSLFLKAITKIKSWFKNDLYLFFSIWFIFVFLFFSFSGTKLPHYVIYGYTPLFFIMAMYLKEIKNDFLLFLPVILLFTVLLFLPEIALLFKESVKDEFARAVIVSAPSYFTFPYRIFFIFAITLLLILSFNKHFDKITKTVILGFLSVIAVNFFVIPIYGKIAQEPIKEAALISKKYGFDVVMYRLNTPSFIVYSEKFVEKRAPIPGDIVLTKVTALKELKNYKIIYQKNGILLVKVEK
ncbi:ArnT family glycosyltransferase [Nitrosophilus alvini]|uniref:ArnT family glycosyltransferase n=1 Tax=Nitrosophilus alvini TaxID=2714855 RepID=UPI00190B8A83|nr:glycosyltransferase family 39 protein [Nitrosophilus alvini]